MENTTIISEIGILGMGPTRIQCDWSLPEIWGVNNGYRQVTEMKGHLEKLFLAHCQVQDHNGDNIFDWGEINALNIDVINTHRVKGLKSRLFPFTRICKKFDTNYFSNSICYMIAYALDRATDRNLRLWQPTTIHLYGADMLENQEYQIERPGIEYWIGKGETLGVKFTVSEGSTLLRTVTGKPYGMRLTLKEFDPYGLLRGGRPRLSKEELEQLTKC